MFQKLGVLFISLTLSSSALAGSSWKRISLKASNGSEVQINYQVQEVVRGSAKTLIAAPLWIDVMSRNNGTLRAVVLNFKKDGRDNDLKLMRELHLDLFSVGTGYWDRNGTYIPGHHTRYYAEVPGGLPIAYCKSGDCDNLVQEIAFVDEKGEWYVDPISQSHNFQFQLR